MVEMTLTAKDAAGNSRESAKKIFRLLSGCSLGRWRAP